MFQGIFKSAINDANKNYIFGTGSIPIQIKTAQLATFADGTTKQQGYQVAEVNKLISTMLTGWSSNGNKPKSMSDNYLELILSCGNGVVVKKRLQFPHIIAWKDDSTPYNIADVYKEFSVDNWLKADDFENPDITLVVEPTDEILTTSTATPPEVTTTNSGRFYLYYRNLPVGVNRIHIDFHIKTKTEPIDFDLEVIDGISWKDAQTILASNEQAKINVLLSTAKDVYKYTGAEGNFENITMHEWSALYQSTISLSPNNKFTHDLYFYLYEESVTSTDLGLKISDIPESEHDLDISDENGNVIAEFREGHFITKNFDSRKISKIHESEHDLDISDENENILVSFSKGHIKTKNFDSSNLIISSIKGKRISILGDSISTCIENNAVEFTVLSSDVGKTLQGYPTYYDIGTTIGGKQVTSAMVGTLTSFEPTSNDIGKVIGTPLNYNDLSQSQLWWGILAKKLGAKILQNVSWSGASMSSHEVSEEKYKTSNAWHDAQINKLSRRDSNGNVIEPDIIVIYRGTNDMSHSPHTKLSSFGAGSTSIPVNDILSDGGFGFKEAYCLTIKKIRERYPKAIIICCTLNVFKRINYSEFPTNNGVNTLPEYNNAIREVANYMGCGLIEFDKDGITFENCYPTYISDSATIPTHPNAVGHAKMAEKAYKDIIKI